MTSSLVCASYEKPVGIRMPNIRNELWGRGYWILTLKFPFNVVALTGDWLEKTALWKRNASPCDLRVKSEYSPEERMLRSIAFLLSGSPLMSR